MTKVKELKAIRQKTQFVLMALSNPIAVCLCVFRWLNLLVTLQVKPSRGVLYGGFWRRIEAWLCGGLWRVSGMFFSGKFLGPRNSILPGLIEQKPKVGHLV